MADARRLVDDGDGDGDGDGDDDDGSVLVLSDGLVVGAVDAEVFAGRADDVPVLDVMRPVPSTVRPSVTVASVVEAGGGGRVVTTSDGRLLGLFTVEAGDQHDHDHGEPSVDMERYEDELGSVMKAMEERFGDSEPSGEEVHAFLRERLLADGKTPEEADAFLQKLAD